LVSGKWHAPSGQLRNRRHVDATPVSAHTSRRETTYGGFVGSRYQTSTAPHAHDNHHAVLTHARPAHTMPATLLSSSSQTHAMLCRVRQQNPASGVSGRHAVGGRGAVVLRSATFTRPRGNARRVVVPHAQARGEPPRAVKQDAAIADLAPKQLPVEQRKVRFHALGTGAETRTGVRRARFSGLAIAAITADTCQTKYAPRAPRGRSRPPGRRAHRRAGADYIPPAFGRIFFSPRERRDARLSRVAHRDFSKNRRLTSLTTQHDRITTALR